MRAITSAEPANGRSVAARALGLASTAREMGERAVRSRLDVEHVVDDTLRAARHAARQGRFAAEDLVDGAELQIRRHPLRSMGWAFGLGTLVGLAAGSILTLTVRRS